MLLCVSDLSCEQRIESLSCLGLATRRDSLYFVDAKHLSFGTSLLTSRY